MKEEITPIYQDFFVMTEAKLEKLENQIKQEQQSVSYDIREFTIEYYVDKYLKGIEKDDNEIYVPDYQREFIWDYGRQSRFIESIFLGLPIPLIFVAEIEETGRLEIVDGSQRIRTLAAYVQNDLKIQNLKKLSELNGLNFEHLKPARQRIFKNSSLRMIVLSTKATPEVRNDMFGRINTSSVPLVGMETRRGVFRGPFTDFITEMAALKLFKKLCPIDFHFKDRREDEELILRFFAFADTYPHFKIGGTDLDRTGVANFLDRYYELKNSELTKDDLEKRKDVLVKVLKFVERTFPERGFGKYKNSQSTSRSYFEAIAVGALLALRKKPDLVISDISWSHLDKRNPNELFKALSGKYHTHRPASIRERLELVRDKLLENAQH
ncbi:MULTISPECIES: DUF262 domain-containing protein [unclassified Imperialibacter]|uniref:DUF262 domain-containing protein n=1 Tax=unclassified Imperialibacter TaxID=2629706 RepID=UPI0012579C3A|nr:MULTISPECIES: DUF262 domain-containing protein [unclassified Imperialibacter]CAD5256072.1 conserved hypothetical protein [Imperialibacter sp. 89]CAD5262171.1 conserved hypothetical protein [Imperialibacter sp. 75]VVT33099.1 conserved hypothetical protein [Imperialibacter sp. EC-SDR9]